MGATAALQRDLRPVQRLRNGSERHGYQIPNTSHPAETFNRKWLELSRFFRRRTQRGCLKAAVSEWTLLEVLALARSASETFATWRHCCRIRTQDTARRRAVYCRQMDNGSQSSSPREPVNPNQPGQEVGPGSHAATPARTFSGFPVWAVVAAAASPDATRIEMFSGEKSSGQS